METDDDLIGESAPATPFTSRKMAFRSGSDELARDQEGLSSVEHAWLLRYWRTKVPFLVRLRDCTHGRLGDPDHFPAVLASGPGKPDAAWVTSVLRGGRALVLLDGIDEIPTKKRESIRKEVQAIVERFPDNLYVLSTRPEAVPKDWLRALGFREARVRPMSNADKQIFIDRWHTAVAGQLRRRGRSRDADGMPALAQELKEKLPDQPSIHRLAEVPLLCAMICALHRERHQRLPESQWELCEALCLMLLHRRERESGLDLSEFPKPYRGLLYEQKRAIVRELAHAMVRNGVSALDVPTAEERVTHVLRSFPDHSPDDAPVVCKSLVERSGMLREARPDVIDFIHNTFKEFLAAEVFVENSDVKLLVDHATEEAWQQVVIFAAATRNPKFASKLIKALLRHPLARGKARDRKAARAEAEALRARQLLALRCRAVALHLDPDLREQLDDLVGDLFPPRTMADAEALAAGGEVYRSSQEFLNRAQHLPFDHPEAHAAFQTKATKRLAELVPEVKRGRLHRKDLVRKQPELAVGPIACGDTVGAAEAFGVALKKQRNRNLLALEMKSGGLLAAVHAKADLSRTLVIRGISDFGDERKKDLDRIGAGALRRYAMGNAIELLWTLLEFGALPRRST